jgi:uncharacterized protein
MRWVSIIFSASFLYAASIGAALSAPNCANILQSPADYIVCNDSQLTALDEELEFLFQSASKANALPKPGAQNTGSVRKSLETSCKLQWPFESGADVLHGRPCVTDAYLTQFKRVGPFAPPRLVRLRDQPPQITALNSYFTIVATMKPENT